MINNIIFTVNSCFQIYFWLILVRCLLSFIPSIDWYKQPFLFVKEATGMYLNLFRSIVPPVAGLDFSPIVAIVALQIINYIIVYILLFFKA